MNIVLLSEIEFLIEAILSVSVSVTDDSGSIDPTESILATKSWLFRFPSKIFLSANKLHSRITETKLKRYGHVKLVLTNLLNILIGSGYRFLFKSKQFVLLFNLFEIKNTIKSNRLQFPNIKYNNVCNLRGFLASNEQHSNSMGIILSVRICKSEY